MAASAILAMFYVLLCRQPVNIEFAVEEHFQWIDLWATSGNNPENWSLRPTQNKRVKMSFLALDGWDVGFILYFSRSVFGPHSTKYLVFWLANFICIRVYDVLENLSVLVKCHVRHGIPWSIDRQAYCVALSVSEWVGHWRFYFLVFCALLLNETQKTFFAIPCNVLVNHITLCIPDICHKHSNRWLQVSLLFPKINFFFKMQISGFWVFYKHEICGSFFIFC